MPPRVRPPLRRVEAGDDSGFTVVEAMVAFVLLALVAAATMVAIVNATKTSTSSAARVTAANLAQSDLQNARALRYPDYPAAVAPTTTTVQGTNYTVSRSVATTAKDGSPLAACPSTPDYNSRPYMVVTTTVSWPPGGSRNSVAMATEIAC